MNINQIYDCEARRLRKFHERLLLPNYFRKVGIALLIISIITLLALGFFVDGTAIIKEVAKKIILVSLLLIALSREKIEDELIEKLRGQAYSFAFVCGVIYALIQPLINYLTAAVVRPEKAIFAELSVFIILWFMLVVYLCIFYLLARTR